MIALLTYLSVNVVPPPQRYLCTWQHCTVANGKVTECGKEKEGTSRELADEVVKFQSGALKYSCGLKA